MLLSSSYPFLADQYLDLLAIEWQRRQALLGSHTVSFTNLIEIDRRISACGAGLELLAPIAKELINTRLEQTIMSSEMFAIMVFALCTGDKEIQSTCYGLAQSIPKLRRPFAAALTWVPSPRFNQSTAGLNSGNPMLRAMILDAFIAHDDAVDGNLRSHWVDRTSVAEPGGGAMHYAIHVADANLPHGVADLLHADLPIVRCQAADAILAKNLKQSIGHAIQVLQAIAIGDDDAAQVAVEILACYSAEAIAPVLLHLAKNADCTRTYLQALAWSGALTNVETLVGYLDDFQYGRIAAAGLSMLTGSLPARDGWIGPPRDAVYVEPDTGPDIPAKDPDANLPVADKTAFLNWWARNESRFNRKSRSLGGLPEAPENLIRVLGHGKLAWRNVAARRLDYLTATGRLQTSAPSHSQQRRLEKLQGKLHVS